MRKLSGLVGFWLLVSPAVSLASDCIRFEDMDVKILKQEYGKAFLSWKAQVKSECRGTVSLFVKLQFLDGRGRELEDSLVPVSNLGSSESRFIETEKTVPPDILYRTREYRFKARIDPSGRTEEVRF